MDADSPRFPDPPSTRALEALRILDFPLLPDPLDAIPAPEDVDDTDSKGS